MVVPPIFTADIPVGPKKQTLDFQGFYNYKAMFSIWHYITILTNDIYLCLKYLQKIRGLVLHYTHHDLHNLYPMNEPRWKLPFASNLRNFSAISLFGNILDIKLRIKNFCLFLCILDHFYWDILPLVLHHCQFGYGDLDCLSQAH